MWSIDASPSPLTLLWTLTVVVLSVGISGLLLFVVGAGFVRSWGGVFERAAFRRYRTRCSQGDELLARGDFAGAVQIFSEVFFLKPIRYESPLIAEVATYHTGLLSRLITIADEMGKGRARLPALPEADRLLAERIDLYYDYCRARRANDTDRLREDRRRLRDNAARIRVAVERLLDDIRVSEERVLYH
jgi:hypothetical protein